MANPRGNGPSPASKRRIGGRVSPALVEQAKARTGIETDTDLIEFALANTVATKVRTLFEAGEIDVATVVYSRFRSAISQIVTRQQLIPVALPEVTEQGLVYEYEPEEDEILTRLLPRNLAVQIFRALLENNASFYGAQMSAMDNATRNAGDMIRKQTLIYNRTRQAMITKELIEIISGAEAI